MLDDFYHFIGSSVSTGQKDYEKNENNGIDEKSDLFRLFRNFRFFS